MKLALLLGVALFAGCATFGQPDNLYSKGCAKTYEGDIIVLTCETQDQVTRYCAKRAKVSDQGFMWDRDGRGPNGERIGACTTYRPRNEDYPFVIAISKQEAWRRSHEEGCHVALYRKYGLNANHSVCKDYGSEWERGKKRL